MKTKTLLAFISLALASQASASVILNEFNAVRDTRWLDVDGAGASTASDSHFGRIEGNGGRWFETLVVGTTTTPGETIDMRGWSFEWSDLGVGSGSFQLTNDNALSAIHRGTVLTFIQEDASGPSVPSNFGSYDPANGSWWLNINVADSQFVLAGGTLLTGNDDWNVHIKDSLGNTVFGPAGENTPGGINTGVNSREVGKLEESHGTILDWQAVTPSSGYSDGTSSSFGSENVWGGGSNEQDFSSLRVIPEPSTALLGGLGLLALLRRSRK